MVKSTALYIFSFLHQTTTQGGGLPEQHALYIFSFLHQTTTPGSLRDCLRCCISSLFYIKPQHPAGDGKRKAGCISSLFYIKPQRWHCLPDGQAVVYLLFSTSNHNPAACGGKRAGCISSLFYIKPQRCNHP